jgi:hypothetical protein
MQLREEGRIRKSSSVVCRGVPSVGEVKDYEMMSVVLVLSACFLFVCKSRYAYAFAQLGGRCGWGCMRLAHATSPITTHHTTTEKWTLIDDDTVVGMIERGEVDFDQMVFTVSEDIDMKIPRGRPIDLNAIVNESKMLGDRLCILKQAHLWFSLLSRVSYNSALDFERHYRALFDDICTHRQIWFDRFFSVDTDDPTRAEFSTGILGTLCTILRQRGDIKGCNEVMQMYMAVLKRYQLMTEKCDDEGQVFCCDTLTLRPILSG